MNTSLPRVAPASPVTPVHTPQAGAQGKPTAPDRVPERPASARPFADMLRQRRADASPPAPAPAPARQEPPRPSSAAEPGPDADTDASTPEKNVSSMRAKARLALSSKGSARPDKIASDPKPSETRAGDDPAPASTADRGPSAADAGAARPVPLADERALPALPRAGHGCDGAGEGAGDIDDGAGRSDVGDLPGAGASAPRPRSSRTAANDAGAASGERSIRAEGLEPSPSAPAAPGAPGASHAEAGANRPALDLPPMAAPLGTAASAPLASGEPMRADPTVPTLTLPTPVDSPQFSGAFGVQVSVLAKGGVQHAELHLNPAEMGPVSIRIELDGSDAQVQFGADLAETRQAIERGLPELASALRDAGFTLSGGGVSQHAGQRGGADGDGATSHRAGTAARLADADASGTEPLRPPRLVAAGGVDLYA